jgi:hypothetical protein
MSWRRSGVAALVVAAAGLLGTACEPQLELGLVMHRDATLLSGSTGSLVTLFGTLYCNRDISQREPVDLFVRIEQASAAGNSAFFGSVGELDCHGTKEGTDFNREFRSSVRLAPGEARLRAEACTNPSEPIDEDCVRVERLITLR